MEARRQVQQGGDPRVLPQHGAVRPGRVRHRGGRAGVPRQDGQRKNAPAEQQVTAAEAMVLVAMVKQPEANPDDPEGQPGYDPTRSARRAQNSIDRWSYIRDGHGRRWATSTAAEADATWRTRTPCRDYDPSARPVRPGPADRPGRQPRAERAAADRAVPGQAGRLHPQRRLPDRHHDRQAGPGRGRGGRRHPPATARRRRCAGQPPNWQAALVAVEPGTGRVLAYYGGNDGAGADYAGWYLRRGRGGPGLRRSTRRARRSRCTTWPRRCASNISPGAAVYDSPATKEFPASGRTKGSRDRAGPQRRHRGVPAQLHAGARPPSPRSTCRSSS